MVEAFINLIYFTFCINNTFDFYPLWLETTEYIDIQK